jgi:hypothetical protein
LEFSEDTNHALIPALRRVGGWIAIVSHADRWRTLAFYRVADGKNFGAGIDLAQFPLRIVVHEPEVYPEIATWLGAFKPAPESTRVVAVFPRHIQQRLHDKIQEDSKRKGLPPGPRSAVVAISPAEPIGIAVRWVTMRQRPGD